MQFIEKSHKRYNPLTGDWVLVSPHRLSRPWQGLVEVIPQEIKPQYDPACYLCPNNKRKNGIENPDYKSTFVFENDFSALMYDHIKSDSVNKNGLLIAQTERGICRVVCFSPRHDLTLAQMNKDDIRKVVDTWIEQYIDLGKKENINYVQIFENKGELMGCSNPHPHCQIWATESIPSEPIKEHSFQEKYFKEKNSCLLCDYLKLETSEKERIIYENKNWVVLVPFWAVWPFETMILPKNHLSDISQMTEEEKEGFADILKVITTKYDNIFKTSFPYSMGFHQTPTDNKKYPYIHSHIHFYPPLLRSASIRKFMVGFEMLGSAQRDITPELAAQKLKEN